MTEGKKGTEDSLLLTELKLDPLAACCSGRFCPYWVGINSDSDPISLPVVFFKKVFRSSEAVRVKTRRRRVCNGSARCAVLCA